MDTVWYLPAQLSPNPQDIQTPTPKPLNHEMQPIRCQKVTPNKDRKKKSKPKLKASEGKLVQLDNDYFDDVNEDLETCVNKQDSIHEHQAFVCKADNNYLVEEDKFHSPISDANRARTPVSDDNAEDNSELVPTENTPEFTKNIKPSESAVQFNLDQNANNPIFRTTIKDTVAITLSKEYSSSSGIESVQNDRLNVFLSNPINDKDQTLEGNPDASWEGRNMELTTVDLIEVDECQSETSSSCNKQTKEIQENVQGGHKERNLNKEDNGDSLSRSHENKSLEGDVSLFRRTGQELLGQEVNKCNIQFISGPEQPKVFQEETTRGEHLTESIGEDTNKLNDTLDCQTGHAVINQDEELDRSDEILSSTCRPLKRINSKDTAVPNWLEAGAGNDRSILSWFHRIPTLPLEEVSHDEPCEKYATKYEYQRHWRGRGWLNSTWVDDNDINISKNHMVRS